MNAYKDLKKLIKYSKEGIISKELLKNNKINLSLFCMSKNTRISDHTSTKQGFVYILEGNGIFKLKEKKILMKQGIIIYLEKNAVHSLEAKENTSFILSLFE